MNNHNAPDWVLNIILLLAMAFIFGIPLLFGIIAAIRYAITGELPE